MLLLGHWFRVQSFINIYSVPQFKIHEIQGVLYNDKVVRLDNGYPTTKREKDEYDARQEKNLQVRRVTFTRAALRCHPLT